MENSEEFHHPGEYVENYSIPLDRILQEYPDFSQYKNEYRDIRFWNCCLESSEDAQGCQKGPRRVHSGFFDVYCGECRTCTGERYLNSGCNAPCAALISVWNNEPNIDTGRGKKFREWSCCGSSSRNAPGCCTERIGAAEGAEAETESKYSEAITHEDAEVEQELMDRK